MMQFANARVVASVPGHLRVEVPQLYRSDAVKKVLEAAAARQLGVTAARASTLTARMLILFEPGLDAAVLLAALGIGAAHGNGAGAISSAGSVTRMTGAGWGAAAMAAAPGPAPGPAPRPAPAQPAARGGHGADHAPLYGAWHARDSDEALAFFDSSAERGLSDAQAAVRLRQGANVIPQAPPVSSLDILLNQFTSLPIILLGVSAGVSLLTGGIAEAAAIGAVLVLNGAIGFGTERRAESTVASLSELVDDIVLVLRGGVPKRIETSHVVPGDILMLAPGTQLAADIRLLEASGLQIDEAALTGESFPVPKEVARLTGKPVLAERRNMAYRGTEVATGSGKGVVVGTGSRTEAGAIQHLAQSTRRPRTASQIQLDQLGSQLVKASCATCAAIFAVGLLRGHDRLSMFKTAVSLAIAAVPEGLPTVATTSLARGIRRMRDQYVLMRHLHAVEAIGSIQTICLDKTGTLTLNSMSAVAIGTALRDVDPAQVDPELCGTLPELARLLQVCVLCNQSESDASAPDSPMQGSATEKALIELAGKGGIGPALRDAFPVVATELRAAGRNFMRTVHAPDGGAGRLVAVKGSPDEVLAMCRNYLGGGTQPLDDAMRARIGAQNQDMAARQLRVLGFAFSEGGEGATLTWLGLVGLADPLRPGVEQVIQRFHHAGIATVMLTGDQAGTAYGIGKQLRLNNGNDIRIVSSDQLEDADPARLADLVAGVNIFSRVTPAHKLRIVQALQRSGRTVAMTGDGINDSPALRAADIGIAMGSGTDVALSAADIALKNDELDTLLDAVSQGRTITTNIRKSVHFLLSSNLSEILLVACSVTAGFGQPLSPLQLLWLNLLTDMLPAIALAAEPADADVMLRPPRDPKQAIVGRDDMWRYAREGTALAAGALGAYGYAIARFGPGQRAGTIAFDTLVLGQMLHALFCRSDRHRTFFDPALAPNRQMMLAVLSSLGLQAAAHLVPGLRRLLGMSPLDLADLAVIAAGAVGPLLFNEMGKAGRAQGKEGQGQSQAASSATAERSISL